MSWANLAVICWLSGLTAVCFSVCLKGAVCVCQSFSCWRFLCMLMISLSYYVGVSPAEGSFFSILSLNKEPIACVGCVWQPDLLSGGALACTQSNRFYTFWRRKNSHPVGDTLLTVLLSKISSVEQYQCLISKKDVCVIVMAYWVLLICKYHVLWLLASSTTNPEEMVIGLELFHKFLSLPWVKQC